MTERASMLGQYRIQWPALDLELLLALMRGLTVVLILVGLGWALRAFVVRVTQAPGQEADASGGTDG